MSAVTLFNAEVGISMALQTRLVMRHNAEIFFLHLTKLACTVSRKIVRGGDLLIV